MLHRTTHGMHARTPLRRASLSLIIKAIGACTERAGSSGALGE
jgi:hypothetical protein